MKVPVAVVAATFALAACAEVQPVATQGGAVTATSSSTFPNVHHRPGYATYWTGEELWTACGKNSAVVLPEVCRSYIVGVSDGHNASYARGGMATLYCLRVSSMADDLAVVVRNYLKTHPDDRNRSAASLTIKALTLAYPCRRDE